MGYRTFTGHLQDIYTTFTLHSHYIHNTFTLHSQYIYILTERPVVLSNAIFVIIKIIFPTTSSPQSAKVFKILFIFFTTSSSLTENSRETNDFLWPFSKVTAVVIGD